MFIIDFVFIATGGDVVTFDVDPSDEENQPSVEDVVDALKKAVEDGNFEIPLPDGKTLKPDEDFFITYYAEVTPENGKYQINSDVFFSCFRCC